MNKGFIYNHFINSLNFITYKQDRLKGKPVYIKVCSKSKNVVFAIPNFPHSSFAKIDLRISEKSSTRMISLIKCAGDRSSTE